MAHAFWQVSGTSPLYTVQLINFVKNVCMAGGLAFSPPQKINLFCFHSQRGCLIGTRLFWISWA
jgi:hypothetical protein